MAIRPFRVEDAKSLARLSDQCGRGETDFVLNPLWETEDELLSEFRRRDIAPDEHILVADGDGGDPVGMAGFLRAPEASEAGLLCPIVDRDERGRGVGGEILRATLARAGELGIKWVSAAVGTRNRAGYALLTGVGFRPERQVFLMRCDTRPEGMSSPVEGIEFGDPTPEDADAILAIYESCGFEPRTPEQMARFLGDGIHAHSVARQGDRLVGFAELETHWPTRPWVSYVGIEQGLRDRGLGSHLVGWSLARRFERDARHALLVLSPANRTALRAYEKVGFRRFRTVDVLERGL